MTNKIVFVWAPLILLCAAVSADQIVTSDGKTITGTIIDESGDQLTMELGNHMVLHVDKTKVESIKREAPPTPVPIYGRPTPKPVLEPVNPQAGEETEKIAQDGYTISYLKSTVVEKLGDGEPDYDHLPSRLDFRGTWSGVSAQDGNEAKWSSLVILATSTITVPVWAPPKGVTPEQAKQWAKAMEQLNSHLRSTVSIYSDMLHEAGPNLLSLRAGSEADLKSKTDQAWHALLQRTENRRRGAERRAQAKGKSAK